MITSLGNQIKRNDIAIKRYYKEIHLLTMMNERNKSTIKNFQEQKEGKEVMKTWLK